MKLLEKLLVELREKTPRIPGRASRGILSGTLEGISIETPLWKLQAFTQEILEEFSEALLEEFSVELIEEYSEKLLGKFTVELLEKFPKVLQEKL